MAPVHLCSLILAFPPRVQAITLQEHTTEEPGRQESSARNAKRESVSRRSNTAGAGCGAFARKDIIYRAITRERGGRLWYDWCKHVRKAETACASKTSARRKVKATCEEQPSLLMEVFCSWLPSNTCINHTWHRCGLWWIDSWQDVAMKISSTKNLNDCDSQTPKKKNKFLFPAAA